MEMPDRKLDSEDYRYGFNGMEKDDETYAEGGTAYDFGARIYSSRLGRWLSLDPLQAKYPSLSPYNFVANSPLIFVDPDGKEIHISYEVRDEYGERPKLRTVVVNEDGSLSNSDGSAYEGSNKFVAKTAKSINELKDMEGEVGEVIKHLLKKDNPEDGDDRLGIHTIVQNDKVDNAADRGSHNRKKGSNGSISQIRPDVDRSKGNPELENATDEQVVGHELKHAYTSLLEKVFQKNLPKLMLQRKSPMQLILRTR